MDTEMDEILGDLECDPDTGVVVLTGAGDAFCAGRDLDLFFRELKDNPRELNARPKSVTGGAGSASTCSTSRPSRWSTAIVSVAA